MLAEKKKSILCKLLIGYSIVVSFKPSKLIFFSGERPFKCRKCQFGFFKKSDLKQHSGRCQGVKYQCQSCQQVFHFKKQLQVSQWQFRNIICSINLDSLFSTCPLYYSLGDRKKYFFSNINACLSLFLPRTIRCGPKLAAKVPATDPTGTWCPGSGTWPTSRRWSGNRLIRALVEWLENCIWSERSRAYSRPFLNVFSLFWNEMDGKKNWAPDKFL